MDLSVRKRGKKEKSLLIMKAAPSLLPTLMVRLLLMHNRKSGLALVSRREDALICVVIQALINSMTGAGILSPFPPHYFIASRIVSAAHTSRAAPLEPMA